MTSIFTRLDTSALPKEVLDQEAVGKFCRVCFALVPAQLEEMHIAVAHPDAP